MGPLHLHSLTEPLLYGGPPKAVTVSPALVLMCANPTIAASAKNMVFD
jgi:hypothetical protein